MAAREDRYVRFQDWRSEQSDGSERVVSERGHTVFGVLRDTTAGAFPFFAHSSRSEALNKSASEERKPKARVLDPQGPFLQRWNKIFVISCLIAVFVDPLFLYIPVIRGENKCLYLDVELEKAASILRFFTDIFYLLHMLFQFRTGFIAPSSVFGRGALVEDTFEIAKRYLSTYFLLDLLAVLPLPQVFVLVVLPRLPVSEIVKAKNILLLIIVCQYVPRLLRIIPLYLQITRSAGIITETAWAGAAFNLLIYMLASHGFGALWYILSIQRADNCWRKACYEQGGCDLKSLYCESNLFGNNTFIQTKCPTNGTYDIDPIFGIYLPAIKNVSESSNFFEKLFYCFWWGLQSLSSLGQNLKTSTNTSENLFAVFVSASGLVLFALLIGNVQNCASEDTLFSQMKSLLHKLIP